MEVRDLWPEILSDTGVVEQSSTGYRLIQQLAKFLYRRADSVVVLAAGTRPRLIRLGVSEGKIVFLPNGADLSMFEVTSDREVLRDRYGFHKFTAVYAGAHGPANGLDLLLDCADILRSESRDIELVLVGDGISKASLIERAKSKDLTNIRFLDPVPKSEIPLLLSSADVGIHCLADVELFRDAVSPNKVYDYMASGLPVLTNVPGEVGEMVTRSGSGLAVAPDDLAGGLTSLASLSPEGRARMSSAGKKFIASHRSRNAIAMELTEMLNSITSEPLNQ